MACWATLRFSQSVRAGKDDTVAGIRWPANRQPDGLEKGLDLRDLLNAFFYPVQGLSSVGQGRALGRFNHRNNPPSVFDRDQGGGQGVQQEQAEADGRHKQQAHGQAMVKSPAEGTLIAPIQAGEEGLQDIIETAMNRPNRQKLGAQHGYQGQGDKGRDEDAGGHGQGKLAKETAQVAGQQGERNEDGHQRHGCGDDRKADLLGPTADADLARFSQFLPAIRRSP